MHCSHLEGHESSLSLEHEVWVEACLHKAASKNKTESTRVDFIFPLYLEGLIGEWRSIGSVPAMKEKRTLTHENLILDVLGEHEAL